MLESTILISIFLPKNVVHPYMDVKSSKMMILIKIIRQYNVCKRHF